MVKYILQLFLLLLFNSSYSQVVLTGHIEEEGSGERLPYSNVYVSELEIGSSANENGYFTLVGEIKSGMTLRASYVGYKTQNIILTDDMLNGNLVISLTAFRSLQLLPGVSATNENSSGLYVRGGQPQENLVLLD